MKKEHVTFQQANCSAKAPENRGVAGCLPRTGDYHATARTWALTASPGARRSSSWGPNGEPQGTGVAITTVAHDKDEFRTNPVTRLVLRGAFAVGGGPCCP